MVTKKGGLGSWTKQHRTGSGGAVVAVAEDDEVAMLGEDEDAAQWVRRWNSR